MPITMIAMKEHIVDGKHVQMFHRLNKNHTKLVDTRGISEDGKKFIVHRLIKEPSGQIYKRKFILEPKEVKHILTESHEDTGNLRMHRKHLTKKSIPKKKIVMKTKSIPKKKIVMKTKSIPKKKIVTKTKSIPKKKIVTKTKSIPKSKRFHK